MFNDQFGNIPWTDADRVHKLITEDIPDRVAAEEGRSISGLLTDRLEAIVRERKAFDKARRRALARLREGLDLQWTPPRSRDELHER